MSTEHMTQEQKQLVINLMSKNDYLQLSAKDDFQLYMTNDDNEFEAGIVDANEQLSNFLNNYYDLCCIEYKHVELTRAQYDAIQDKDPRTLYCITDDAPYVDMNFSEQLSNTLSSVLSSLVKPVIQSTNAVLMSKREYDELSVHDPNVLYCISDDNDSDNPGEGFHPPATSLNYEILTKDQYQHLVDNRLVDVNKMYCISDDINIDMPSLENELKEELENYIEGYVDDAIANASDVIVDNIYANIVSGDNHYIGVNEFDVIKVHKYVEIDNIESLSVQQRIDELERLVYLQAEQLNNISTGGYMRVGNSSKEICKLTKTLKDFAASGTQTFSSSYKITEDDGDGLIRFYLKGFSNTSGTYSSSINIAFNGYVNGKLVFYRPSFAPSLTEYDVMQLQFDFTSSIKVGIGDTVKVELKGDSSTSSALGVTVAARFVSIKQ